MDLKIQKSSSQGVIEGIPRIDRYFPECFSAAVESLSGFLFGTRDLGKIYGWHTFRYLRPNGPIRFAENKIELDLKLHRISLGDAAFGSRIQEIYGIHVTPVNFHGYENFFGFCMESIREKVPLICDFNLGFIKARREYHRVYSLHYLTVIGCDEKLRQVISGEQMLGTLAINEEDLRGAFEYNYRAYGEFKAYRLSRPLAGERELQLHEVQAQVDVNLKNLESADEALGLRALGRFRKEIGEYFRDRGSEKKPFSVPGSWVFSHERHLLRKWLKSVAYLVPKERAGAFFPEFDSLLERLFQNWLTFDFLLEKCLGTGNSNGLENILVLLDSIIPDEFEALNNWKKLKLLLGNAG